MKVTNSTMTANEGLTSVSQPVKSTPSTRPRFVNDAQDLICFSHLRWNFVYQRPQHLLSRATDTYRVWFLEEPIYDDGEPHLTQYQQANRLTVLIPHLPHGTDPDQARQLQKELLDAFMVSQRINNFVAWYYTPMALLFSNHLKPMLTVYDCMDELSAFWGAPPQLLNQEKELMQRAGVVFTGGYSLYEAKQHRHSNVFAFPSSIDFAHFSTARQPQPDPVDQRGIAGPRIGFSGVIDERFDYQLLTEVARQRHDWEFVLIGPVVKIDRNLLPQSSNVHYLGMKAYDDLPHYFSNWNVAMMPFALNDSTRFISPTKTPEYLAAGLPVVSTPIRDVIRTYGSEDFVQIADSPDSFIRAVELALEEKHPQNWPAIDAFLSENSWNNTWHQMHRVIQMALVSEQ